MVKSNKLLKVLLVIAMIVCIVAISGIVHADAFPDGIEGTDTPLGNNITGWGGRVLGIFQVVGYIVAVVMLAWLGIKYILASPEGKAQIKTQAFYYVLGAALLFAAGTIVGWIKNTVDEAGEEAGSTSYIQFIDEKKV